MWNNRVTEYVDIILPGIGEMPKAKNEQKSGWESAFFGLIFLGVLYITLGIFDVNLGKEQKSDWFASVGKCDMKYILIS